MGIIDDKEVKDLYEIFDEGTKKGIKYIKAIQSAIKKSDEVKFVICNYEDFTWSVEYIKNYKLTEYCSVLFSPSYNVMPISELADLILKNSLNVRLQTQLHKNIWGEVDGK